MNDDEIYLFIHSIYYRIYELETCTNNRTHLNRQHTLNTDKTSIKVTPWRFAAQNKKEPGEITGTPAEEKECKNKPLPWIIDLKKI